MVEGVVRRNLPVVDDAALNQSIVFPIVLRGPPFLAVYIHNFWCVQLSCSPRSSSLSFPKNSQRSKDMMSLTATVKLATRLSRRVASHTQQQLTMMSSQAPTTFSHEKMEADARYKATLDVPESLMQTSKEESPFSIQGRFREGRAAYLDMSATTPLDPRVLDAMAPYMVRKYWIWKQIRLPRRKSSLNPYLEDWILWKPSQSYPCLWLGSRTCCRIGSGTNCEFDRSRCQGDRLYERSYRIKQYVDQRSCSFLQKERKTYHHHPDGAQVRLGFMP